MSDNVLRCAAARTSRRGLLAAAAGVALPLARAAAAPQAAPQAPAPGTMFRGVPAKTGEMPGPDVASAPSVRWRVDASASEWLAPAVSGGRVFATLYERGLAAFDAASGDALWFIPASPGDTFDSSPAVAGETVFAGAGPYALLAVDAASGAERWRYDASGAGRASAPGPQPYAPVCSSPTIAGDFIYVGVWSGSGDQTMGEAPENGIHAVDLASGAERWRYPVRVGAISSPAVADGAVYVLDRAANALAIDAATGALRWRTPLGGVASSSPVAANGIVWAAVRGGAIPENGGVIALDANSGAPLWRRNLLNPTSPALIGATLVIGQGDGSLLALDAVTGATAWTFSAGGAVAAPTFVPGGQLYLATNANDVIALDPAAGLERWRFRGDSPFLSSPTVAGAVAYIGDTSGALYALAATT